MAMRNAAWGKLCREFDLNLRMNNGFRELCRERGILRVDMYGNEGAGASDMEQARKEWKARKGALWFEWSDEVDAWLDAMPFGGYEKESDGTKVVKEYRKAEKARRSA